MSDQEINQLLQDLFAADPALASQEEKLRILLREMLDAKPPAKIDPDFKNKLKFQLIERFHSMEEQKPKFNFDSAKLARHLIPGLAIIALIVVAGGYVYQQQRLGKFGGLSKNIFTKNTDYGTLKITPTKELAFGNLQSTSQTSSPSNTAAPSAAPNTANGTTGLGGGMGGGMASPKMAPNLRIRQPGPYKFVYKGDKLDLKDSKLDVLKRQQGALQGSPADQVLSSLNLGLIDISSFSNTKVAQLTINQNTDFGYSINLDFNSGSISLYQQYDKWPQPVNYTPLTGNDLPDDATLIGYAKDFVSQHNINTSAYGDPVVQPKANIIYYAEGVNSSTATPAQTFVPDQINVLYPLVINGMNVYDQSGGKVGLNVSVDIRNKRVAGLYGLNSQVYESSSYDAETDPAQILAIAEKGGFNTVIYPVDAGGATKGGTATELDLGTPEIQLMQYFQYTNNQTNELYVPALVFPITNAPDNLYRKNVIVPLIKEILNQSEQPPVGIYQPMMSPSGTGTASSGVVASPPTIAPVK